mmetsp:Transcript_8915/g.19627  ORF Transcript_8915/g.19627 Transcript_8915/m.19627 type:complete len:130 (-) Transcript_8915:263-652(-)|eukprot:CAMPEP_0113303884 /NCGR_PEP_ID=MMETSP0010_2-20120614/4111_1 /TAXON_ID=216773 ORGANISM="Corethron hystrix, Strain 308" /NCGR_SAMPLE_ID=MMETSP0010_2 /ASSEMBLY_ACC=CAM_ASM_000155 /LENGTH=129 /DNA_ID=CAMNT_0000157949 /DNA_START=114 /DNA_END=503 /DNA_ORIENTATION=- /assembly_acc=CAM_ASM_000155
MGKVKKEERQGKKKRARKEDISEEERSDNSSEESDSSSSSSEDSGTGVKTKKNDDNDTYFDLGSDKKRCTIRKWKSMIFVDIREFYEKNGKNLPGKKGISLRLEDYKKLRDAIKDGVLDKEIEDLGGTV